VHNSQREKRLIFGAFSKLIPGDLQHNFSGLLGNAESAENKEL